ncbi:putative signal transduction protein with CBS domains [Metallosphaera sedula]|uniref:Putative signal transduction protein with CBS domains n=3 Tax=Sulfolobaceae TaxID=118883 RepID=A4YE11_METS5|nr:putative signal transduction protein with CBS domains [Metallosphaera sedula DSM 5348]AIM26650.1 putative signal transduction protein with CBS domains [Metallosphaera sedula]
MSFKSLILIMIKVSDVMTPVIVSVTPESDMRELIEVLSRDKSGRVIVLKDGKPEGIVTTRTVVNAYAQYGRKIMELRVKDLMSEKLIKVNVDDNVQDVLRVLIAHDIGGVPVMDGDVIVGIFTERDLVRLMAKKTYSGLVDSIMSPNVFTVDKETDSLEASKLMSLHKVRRLPIMDGDKLVGIVTAADIVKSLLRSVEPQNVLEIGSKDPITVKRLDTIMKAVRIMEERRIGTIPVVEEKLVGIVTERDLLYSAINSL